MWHTGLQGVCFWRQLLELQEQETGERESNGVVVAGDLSGSEDELVCDSAR